MQGGIELQLPQKDSACHFALLCSTHVHLCSNKWPRGMRQVSLATHPLQLCDRRGENSCLPSGAAANMLPNQAQQAREDLWRSLSRDVHMHTALLTLSLAGGRA